MTDQLREPVGEKWQDECLCWHVCPKPDAAPTAVETDAYPVPEPLPAAMGELRKLVSSLTEGATPGPWHAVTQYDPPNDPRWWLDNEAGDSSFVTADHVATMLNAILTLFAALDAAPPAVDVERLARAIHEASGTHSKTPTRMICDNPQWGRAPGVRGGHPRPPRHPMTDLDAIRERARLMGFNGASIATAQEDRRALLAYIDGLAEAVEGLPTDDTCAKHYGTFVFLVATLAALMGALGIGG